MSRQVVVAGIDGTGSADWARADGLNSHVRRFIADISAEARFKKWWHGPDTLGLRLGGIEDAVYEWVVQRMENLIRGRRASQEEIEVVLVGHSRGAVGVMKVANALAEPSIRIAVSRELRSPIRIRFIGLYDAVDRAIGFSPDTALRNVDFCFHAVRRHISTDPERGSRGTFGTVDVQLARRLGHQKTFDTSHGGIGGDMGLFTPLNGTLEDFYCNALRLVLTQEELIHAYGRFVPPGVARDPGMGIEGPPLYTPLTGTQRAARAHRVARFIDESRRADRAIRGATEKAGLRFNGASAHLPYAVKDEFLWRRLQAVLAS